MNLSKYLPSFAMAFSLATNLSYAADREYGGNANQESVHEEEINSRDSQLVKTYLKSKAANKDGQISNLTVSGDLRTEYSHLNEKYEGKQLRGRGGYNPCDDCLPISRNDLDVEFNLRFEYVTEKAWAAAHLQFDNSCGISNNRCCCDGCHSKCSSSSSSDESSSQGSGCNISGLEDESADKKCAYNRFHGSGQGGDVDLKRAYVGYNFYTCGDARFDVELGRRKMYDVFESEIQFLSRYDGILFEYSNTTENFADWYVKLGGFMIDERTNHFGWATEIAFFDIFDSKLDVKYSFIDWTKRGRSRCAPFIDKESSSGSCSNDSEEESNKEKCGGHNPRGFRYRNSQLILTYHLDPELLCRPVEVYAAALWNHACKSQNEDHKSKGLGAYAGITIGTVKKEGDWSVDLQYQYVQESAIAFDDENGIGLGDVLSDCCDPHYLPGAGYKGFRLEGLYAITDNLSIDALIEYADSTNKTAHDFLKFKLETIYAF